MTKKFIPLLLLIAEILSFQIVLGQSEVDSVAINQDQNQVDTIKVFGYLASYNELKYEQPEKASNALNKALNLSKKLNFNSGTINSLLKIGDQLIEKSKNHSALLIYNNAYELAFPAQQKKEILYSLFGQSRALTNLDRLDEADSLVHLSLDLANTQPIDSVAIARGYFILASIAYYRGQHDTSLEYDLKSLNYNQNDLNLRALSFLNLAGTHTSLKSRKKAKEYAYKGLELAEQIGNKRTIALIQNQLGKIHYFQKEYDEAKRFYRLATIHFEKVKNLTRIGQIYYNLADIHIELTDFDQGIQAYKMALSYTQKANSSRGSAHIIYKIGLAYHKLGDFKKAEEYYLKARPLFIELNIPVMNIYVAKRLSDLYAGIGDYEKGYKYLMEHKTLNDSVFTANKMKQIAEIDEKYQNEQKEQEIELLSAENQIANLELQKQENFRNYLIVAAILLALLILVIYNRYKVKERANAKLRELDHLKSNFFVNISHEFRTPLSLIISPIQKLLQLSRDEESKQALSLVHRNATKLNELINQLLDLSKLEAGKLSLQVSKQNLQEFLKITAASFESLADAKKVSFEVQLDQLPTEAYFDENNIQQILNNLLSNAFKFTPEGRSIIFKSELKENHVFLSVIDGGPGISEEEQKLIFQRFHQSKNNDPHITGTGVGLTLSKELALLHKGDIELKSDLGKGATFTLHFPIFKEAYNTDQIAEKQDSGHNYDKNTIETFVAHEEIESSTSVNEEVVLIVEDNPDLSNHMATLLKNKFAIKQAANGIEGLEIAKETIPDIIISDLMMPEMNGIELSNAIKKDEKTSHIPLVLLTAKADRETKLEGLQTGAEDFLTKPFDNDELLTRIENLIAQRKVLQEKFAKKITLSPSEIDVTSPDEIFLQKALKVVDQNLSNSAFTVELFQKEMAMSRMQLHRKLKVLTNFSASEFIRDLRLQRAADLLSKNGINVTEAAYSCGFNSMSYFTQCFKTKYGTSPSKYAEKVL